MFSNVFMLYIDRLFTPPNVPELSKCKMKLLPTVNILTAIYKKKRRQAHNLCGVTVRP